jgi:phosphate transport system substrate-binding protein
VPLEQGIARGLVARSVLVFTTTAAIAATVVLAARAAEPSDPRTQTHARAPAVVLPGDRCEIAGSGSNVPLVRRLARAFQERSPGDRIVVHDSIGSGGGIRAVHDGGVHIGLVSRPLSRREKQGGLVATPHVRVPVVLAAHPAVSDGSLPMSRLVALLEGRTVRWNDGTRAVLLQRERGDSSYQVLIARSEPFRRAYNHSLGHTHWRVLFHDTEMLEAVADTPGGVGFLDLGVLRLGQTPLSMVRIDGRDPLAPGYPYLKDLAFVTRGAPRGIAARFLDFVDTPESRAIAQAADYTPARSTH